MYCERSAVGVAAVGAAVQPLAAVDACRSRSTTQPFALAWVPLTVWCENRPDLHLRRWKTAGGGGRLDPT